MWHCFNTPLEYFSFFTNSSWHSFQLHRPSRPRIKKRPCRFWPSLCNLHSPLFSIPCAVTHSGEFTCVCIALLAPVACSVCLIFFSPLPTSLAITSCPLIFCHVTLTSPSPPPPLPLPLVPDCPVLIVPSCIGWEQRSIGRWHLLSEPWEKDSACVFV